MNGISPLWQHTQAYRNPQVRTRPKTRRPWKCRQRLRYRQHPRNKSKGEELPSSHQMPDLRVKPKPDPEKEAQQRIIIAKLPEMERTLVALIRECRKRHLIVTPDALLRVARETVPDEIPNIGTILELLGALELKGVIERDAGILKLSSRVG